jgi:hypothetical protein
MTGQAQADESMLRSGLVLERLTRCVDKWDWSALNKFNAIDMTYVLAFPDKPWCWYLLSYTPAFERLTRCVDKWDWSALSKSNAIDMTHVLAFPDKPWCWYLLSYNPNVTLDHVLAHPDKPWCWGGLSRNPNVTLDHVLAHPVKPWCWNMLSSHPNVTLDHVLAHPDKPWCWNAMSSHPNVTLDHVLAHPDKPWCWDGLQRHARPRACPPRQAVVLGRDHQATWNPRRHRDRAGAQRRRHDDPTTMAGVLLQPVRACLQEQADARVRAAAAGGRELNWDSGR